jgi:hypothetical protein
MSKVIDALHYLLPNGGWTISNQDFDTLIYDEGVEPITKKQFDDALKIIDKVNADKELAKANAKSALLNKLGITAEEAVLLLS